MATKLFRFFMTNKTSENLINQINYCYFMLLNRLLLLPALGYAIIADLSVIQKQKRLAKNALFKLLKYRAFKLVRFGRPVRFMCKKVRK